jgi:tRNA threonylcarbamoyladenosine biosynthesis protein TsaB
LNNWPAVRYHLVHVRICKYENQGTLHPIEDRGSGAGWQQPEFGIRNPEFGIPLSLILHINTALPLGTVSLADDDRLLGERSSGLQMEHAAFLQPAIRDLMAEQGAALSELSAVAVVHGPGSYTGLRVGMAAAKGFCYALHLPLITVNTLEWMAEAAKGGNEDMICPMIDARRNEVFTALYDREGRELVAPNALILDENSFSEVLEQGTVRFFGDGSEKFRAMFRHRNAIFMPAEAGPIHLSLISRSRFLQTLFTASAYAEPLYVKEFHTPAPGRHLKA